MDNETQWQKAFREIHGTGMTFRAIQAELGCSLGAVTDLASGRSQDAAYSLGVKILALHKRVTRKRRRKA